MLKTLASKNSFHEMNILWKLTIPLILTGLVEASIGFFSTLFLAHLGEEELAAGAIVSWVFVTIMVILWGTLCSISVLVSQKHGQNDTKGAAHILRDGLALSLIFVFPTMILLWYLSPILLLIGERPTTVAYAQDYLHGLVWGILPDFIGLVLMQFVIGLGHTRTNMFFTFLWVPLNILCNYTLIFGKFGFTAMGMAGIGWGTTLAYWITTALLITYLLIKKNYTVYFRQLFQLRPPHYLAEIWEIGLPMGAMYCIEIGFFLILTLLMGDIGTEVLAANQIALQYGGLSFVIMFAIAQAVTVRMGHMLGAKKADVAERTVYFGMIIALIITVIIAILFCTIPYILIGIDLNLTDKENLETIRLARQFLAISACFQIVETIRITYFGALRGLRDTRFTLLTSVISFWFVALPIGYILAEYFNWEGAGYWWGLVIGAALGAVLLYKRYQFKMKHYNNMHIRSQEYLQNQK